MLWQVHVRFELPAGGNAPGVPVKPSAGVGGGGACDAVGIMIPSVVVSFADGWGREGGGRAEGGGRL